MEVSQGPDYRYYKANLYPPVQPPGAVREPLGTVEIEITGPKGRMNCRTRQCLGLFAETHLRIKYQVMLQKEMGGEPVVIGHLSVDRSGCGVLKWDFSTAGSDSGEGTPVTYKLLIAARNDVGLRGKAGGGVLMSGVISLKSAVRDNRVVGFKKEVKVREKGRDINKRNPFFEKVEPFQPPIPNSVWWRIGVLPDSYWQTGFCPRQKTNKAMY
ncbi:MAG: hypothetical protein WC834_04955 [Eubacteriales bacterium]